MFGDFVMKGKKFKEGRVLSFVAHPTLQGFN
jgi:hypothetical protein